jgi:hypothetical protein
LSVSEFTANGPLLSVSIERRKFTASLLISAWRAVQWVDGGWCSSFATAGGL